MSVHVRRQKIEEKRETEEERIKRRGAEKGSVKICTLCGHVCVCSWECVRYTPKASVNVHSCGHVYRCVSWHKSPGYGACTSLQNGVHNAITCACRCEYTQYKSMR